MQSIMEHSSANRVVKSHYRILRNRAGMSRMFKPHVQQDHDVCGNNSFSSSTQGRSAQGMAQPTKQADS